MSASGSSTSCCPELWWCDDAGGVFSRPAGPKPASGVRGPYTTEAMARAKCQGESGSVDSGSGPGTCSGDAGVDVEGGEPLTMTVAGCGCPTGGSLDGTFPLTYQGTSGIPLAHVWRGPEILNPCGNGANAFHELWYIPSTGCWHLAHVGECGFEASEPDAIGFVHSVSPLDIGWEVSSATCAGCTTPITVTVYR